MNLMSQYREKREILEVIVTISMMAAKEIWGEGMEGESVQKAKQAGVDGLGQRRSKRQKKTERTAFLSCVTWVLLSTDTENTGAGWRVEGCRGEMCSLGVLT